MSKALTIRSDLGLGPQLSLPDDIKKQMQLWRLGAIAMPESYINWHRERADEALQALLALYPGLRVIDQTMRNGGWFDGMRELHAIVETPSGRAVKLVYCDSNQGFMVRQSAHGGQSALRDTDIT